MSEYYTNENLIQGLIPDSVWDPQFIRYLMDEKLLERLGALMLFCIVMAILALCVKFFYVLLLRVLGVPSLAYKNLVYYHQLWRMNKKVTKLSLSNHKAVARASLVKNFEVIEKDGFKLVIDYRDGGKVVASHYIGSFVDVKVEEKKPEMAIPSNDFIKCESSDPLATSAKGVLSIRNASGNVVSMGSRQKVGGQSCFVTAFHSWKEVLRGGPDMKMEHNGLALRFEEAGDWKIVFCSGETKRDIIALVPSKLSLWASLKVKELIPKPFQNSSNVTLYGFTNEGLHYTSSTAFDSDEWGVIKYTASTLEGWSGTPVMSKGYVVGVHCHARESLGCNGGTSTFWLDLPEFKNKKYESEPLFKGRRFVDELPVEAYNEKYRTFDFRTEHFHHRITYIGSFAKRESRPVDPANPLHYTGEDDFFDQYYENANPSDSISDPRNAFEEDRSDFPQGVQLTYPQILSEFTNLVDSIGKKEALNKQELDSVKSVLAQIVSSVKDVPKETNSLIKLQSGEIHLTTGNIPPETPKLSAEASTCKPQDIQVLMVCVTRKQEKLFNRISSTRRFQKALREATAEERNALRRRLLEFVSSSKTMLVENPLQDFLLTL